MIPTNRDDQNFVPETYEELYAHYLKGEDSLGRKLLRRFVRYADEDETETLIQDVALRLIEHHMIERFDPSKANFGGVIYFVTRTIAANHLARKERNPITGLRGGSLVTEEKDEFAPGEYSLARVFADESALESEAALDNKARAAHVKQVAAEAKGNNKRDRSLSRLVDLLAEGASPKECALELGVSPSTIHNWMEHLAVIAA